jgi:hypothetical protein
MDQIDFKSKTQVTILLLLGRYAVLTVKHRVFRGIYYCHVQGQYCHPKRQQIFTILQAVAFEKT